MNLLIEFSPSDRFWENFLTWEKSSSFNHTHSYFYPRSSCLFSFALHLSCILTLGLIFKSINIHMIYLIVKTWHQLRTKIMHQCTSFFDFNFKWWTGGPSEASLLGSNSCTIINDVRNRASSAIGEWSRFKTNEKSPVSGSMDRQRLLYVATIFGTIEVEGGRTSK